VKSQTPSVSRSTTSWGPIHTAIGDIIVAATGCRLPLVLRPIANSRYLSDGACWLIDGGIGDASTKISGNPGFSGYMHGKAFEGLDDESQLETFAVQ
jgi:hypothetical protein